MSLPEHKHFVTVHGKKVKTLLELRRVLVDMSDKDFRHHVTSDRNDFAVWVRDILHLDFLADKLEKFKDKEHIEDLINDELLKEHKNILGDSQEFRKFMAKEFVMGMIFGIFVGALLIALIWII